MQIKLNNSLTKSVENFSPLEGNVVRMYSCGPTVYNYAHIGNMRAFLFADLLQRTLRTVGGYEVRWVMNITNIDDKTIRGSAPGSPDWLPQMGVQTDNLLDNLLKFTTYYESSFLDDISKLGISPKHFFAMPRATEYIPQMQELVRRIAERGMAYESDGSIYFNVAEWRKVDVYGKLFYIDFENFRSGVRIDSDQYEREQASDFVLWKARREGEPFWEFNFEGKNCPGRPGWHLECSAMEAELLGLPFDIHTGGIDLKFPHHEDEIAQSKAGYGIEPTAFWCHNEYLEVEGKKMSKSLGNFFTLRDLLSKGIDALNIRFALLSAHYASTYNFTFEGIGAAHSARSRVQNYIYDLFSEDNGAKKADASALETAVFAELANDLHTPKALAQLFSFMNTNPANQLDSESKTALLAFFRKLNDIFAVWRIEPKEAAEISFSAEVIAIAEERLIARKAKDWAKSDVLRQKLLEKGVVVKDSKEGYTLEQII
jgi:cysteinyl-tRNA synthetase